MGSGLLSWQLRDMPVGHHMLSLELASCDPSQGQRGPRRGSISGTGFIQGHMGPVWKDKVLGLREGVTDGSSGHSEEKQLSALIGWVGLSFEGGEEKRETQGGEGTKNVSL